MLALNWAHGFWDLQPVTADGRLRVRAHEDPALLYTRFLPLQQASARAPPPSTGLRLLAYIYHAEEPSRPSQTPTQTHLFPSGEPSSRTPSSSSILAAVRSKWTPRT
jgi:hypothetical protein